MGEYRGRFRSAYNHPDVVISLSDYARSQADGLLSFFEAQIKAGTVFRAGETVQFGFGVLLLRKDEAGDLTVWEPSYSAMPIEWVLGADETSRFLLVQREVCRRVGVEPDFPYVLQTCVATARLLREGDGFAMTRSIPHGDTGWILQGRGEDFSEPRRCSLYEAAVRRPSTVPYFALPPGASIAMSPGGITVEFGSKTLSSQKDKFLADLYTSRIFGWRFGAVP